MKSWFLSRGYSKTLIDTEVTKVNFPITSGDKKIKTSRTDFAKVIKKHLHLLHINDEVKKDLLLVPQCHFGKRKS